MRLVKNTPIKKNTPRMISDIKPYPALVASYDCPKAHMHSEVEIMESSSFFILYGFILLRLFNIDFKTFWRFRVGFVKDNHVNIPSLYLSLCIAELYPFYVVA